MHEERVDLRVSHPEELEKARQQAQLIFRLNHTMPMTEEYAQLLKELLGDRKLLLWPAQALKLLDEE